ncbi:ATP-binding cassette domain-containing protein [Nocardioides yefusunii]|uniref:UvrABC system protein A n=1 Tax=Nocardioides yefusunii TaxID=2500546 RepID=A0ABW1QTW8_9ACTN|nr:excinuclease ABC subunit UvrA [Nocardioides yefusunii]
MSGHHPADAHATIRVVGARENNLRDVDVTLPKRRLTVFTGVSGSGKSSLVFSTIAAESQRMVNETYSSFVQGFMASPARPDVDVLDGLTAAIVVDQERIGSDPRSTVGTATDAAAMLRILFSRLGVPHVGGPQAFSFNVASATGSGALKVDRGADTKAEHRTFEVLGGMCVRCEGRGQVSDIDLHALVDFDKSIAEGAILVPGYSMDGWYGRIYAACGFFDVNAPVNTFTEAELHALFHTEPTKIKADGINVTYDGLIPKMTKSMLAKDRESMQPHIRAFVDSAVVFTTCPDCDGTRLNDRARSSLIDGVSIADVARMQVSDLAAWVRTLTDPSAHPGAHQGVGPLVESLAHTLEAMVDIGLGYITLERPAATLSGGEAQRVKMVRHLGSALTDVTYVFDEPSIGLHPHDVQRMNALLLALRDKGNTVLVVEHKPEVIAIADHVVDLGPGAGAAGGQICFTGTVDELRDSDTVTGRHLDDRPALKETVRTPTGWLEVRGATRHNLTGVDVDVPTGVLCVITGVAGSGKSTLVNGWISTRDDVVTVDQSPIKGSRRSNPATYTGLLEPVRKAFAKANGVKPALFSANSDGACPHCKGVGVIYTDLSVMQSVASPCDVCGGRRFAADVLAHTLGGASIADVFDMAVDDALPFFSAGEAKVPAAAKILTRLADVGLGYLRLGQPLTTLSGGERQRLKLATRMGEPGDVYVLDEPTTGLHLADIATLTAMLDRLVDAGKSVIVVEHHQTVMAHADWIIDLGPGAGHDGGQVVFTGTPGDLVAQAETLTGQHLARHVRQD